MACENGYIEIYNFPRADKATITYGRIYFLFKWTNKFRKYSRCDGCIDEGTRKLEGT